MSPRTAASPKPRSRRTATCVFGYLLVSTSAFGTLSARAAHATNDDDARARARHLGYAGMDAYASGDYAAASDQLGQAYRAFPAPSLGLWSARALAKLGKLKEAVERLEATLALDVNTGEPKVQRQALEQARSELTEIRSRIPTLEVQVFPTGSAPLGFTFNGRVSESAGPRFDLNPGHYLVQVNRDGVSAEADVDLDERDHKLITLRLAPALAPALTLPNPPNAPSPETSHSAESRDDSFQTQAGWIGIGVGSACGMTSIVSFLVASDRLDAIRHDPSCTGNSCAPPAQDLVSDYRSAKSIGIITAISGAVLLTSGLTLLLSRSDASHSSLALQLGASQITTRWNF
ncbi:MAG TPA: tetratricopeptide repeat protein [Polyangiaceae bacterium]|nr:tetratricopeptide repeat protein [Polyangiaceae bacterium]